jgi:hypothetical protein
MVTFAAETYQNEYLAAGGSEVNAIVTISASDTEGGGAGRTVAATGEMTEIIVVDCSGSMNYPKAKLRAAQRATNTALGCMTDGVWFAVIAGDAEATQIFPIGGGLAQASPATVRDARSAVSKLSATGGTAMGQWLLLAADLFADGPVGVHHAILLTDGRDESETPDELDDALLRCTGLFQCDCRGVGTDWEVAELRKVSTALLGTVDIVADPERLEDDFRAMIGQSMGRVLGEVSIRLWTPQGAEVRYVRQVAPQLEDLTERAAAVNPRTSDYPTGAWGSESRDYHICIDVPPGQIGDEMLAGRLSLVVGDEVLSQALLKANWTDDVALSTRINREVAHYTGQAELAAAIQEGLEARKAGDDRTATLKLGRAVQLASASGNTGTAELLAKVVDIEDATTGTVRLKQKVADADEMALDTRSTKTVRVGRRAP